MVSFTALVLLTLSHSRMTTWTSVSLDQQSALPLTPIHFPAPSTAPLHLHPNFSNFPATRNPMSPHFAGACAGPSPPIYLVQVTKMLSKIFSNQAAPMERFESMSFHQNQVVDFFWVHTYYLHCCIFQHFLFLHTISIIYWKKNVFLRTCTSFSTSINTYGSAQR